MEKVGELVNWIGVCIGCIESDFSIHDVDVDWYCSERLAV